MIKCVVFSNQDNVDCFVKKFVAVPRVGDKVLIKYKRNISSTMEMYSKVMTVYHRIDLQGNPFVEIELWSESVNRMNKER